MNTHPTTATYPDAFASGNHRFVTLTPPWASPAIVEQLCQTPPAPKRSRGTEVADGLFTVIPDGVAVGIRCVRSIAHPHVSDAETAAVLRHIIAAAIDAEIAIAEERGRKGERQLIASFIDGDAEYAMECSRGGKRPRDEECWAERAEAWRSVAAAIRART